MKDTIRKECIKHGNLLLEIFPKTKERDPVKLCQKLRKIDAAVHMQATNYCNGAIECEQWERFKVKNHAKLQEIFGGTDVPVFLNSDPRGYALKIDDEWMRSNSSRDCVRSLYRDWGGYGILAPNFNEA